MNKKIISLSIIIIVLACVSAYFIGVSNVSTKKTTKESTRNSKNIEHNMTVYKEIKPVFIPVKEKNGMNKEMKDKVSKITKKKEKKSVFEYYKDEDKEYNEKHGRLHLIEDQSFVDLEKKTVSLGYENEIDRFEDEFVDNLLDIPLKKYETFIDGEDIPFYIENFRFFQYIKPVELKKMISDIKSGVKIRFDFFTLESGNDLVKFNVGACPSLSCYSDDSKYKVYIDDCSVDRCFGDSSILGLDSASFYLNKDGKLIIYNTHDRSGEIRPETKDVLVGED